VAERPRAGDPGSKFDRVAKPTPRSATGRDHRGKEALYSTAPGAEPTSQVLIVCQRCDIESGVSVVAMARVLTPPALWNPVSGRLWGRCPACQRRSWLRVRKGQALRALLDRDVTRSTPHPDDR
jgi:hypothetical protein